MRESAQSLVKFFLLAFASIVSHIMFTISSPCNMNIMDLMFWLLSDLSQGVPFWRTPFHVLVELSTMCSLTAVRTLPHGVGTGWARVSRLIAFSHLLHSAQLLSGQLDYYLIWVPSARQARRNKSKSLLFISFLGKRLYERYIIFFVEIFFWAFYLCVAILLECVMWWCFQILLGFFMIMGQKCPFFLNNLLLLYCNYRVCWRL